MWRRVVFPAETYQDSFRFRVVTAPSHLSCQICTETVGSRTVSGGAESGLKLGLQPRSASAHVHKLANA